jgi:hypothetical protein
VIELLDFQVLFFIIFQSPPVVGASEKLQILDPDLEPKVEIEEPPPENKEVELLLEEPAVEEEPCVEGEANADNEAAPPEEAAPEEPPAEVAGK